MPAASTGQGDRCGARTELDRPRPLYRAAAGHRPAWRNAGVLPAAVQPPDPCNLLTAADVTSLVGPIAYPPKDSALATIHDPGRGCEWPVVLHRVDASGTACRGLAETRG